jgi:hypothetical protein
MNHFKTIEHANEIIVQRLILNYLSPGGDCIRTIEGACIQMQRIGNRHGVPRDATSRLYEVEHPELGFAFTARAVWRDGALMEPWAVHCVVLDYEDRGSHGDDHTVKLAANDWLRSLPV